MGGSFRGPSRPNHCSLYEGGPAPISSGGRSCITPCDTNGLAPQWVRVLGGVLVADSQALHRKPNQSGSGSSSLITVSCPALCDDCTFYTVYTLHRHTDPASHGRLSAWTTPKTNARTPPAEYADLRWMVSFQSPFPALQESEGSKNERLKYTNTSVKRLAERKPLTSCGLCV